MLDLNELADGLPAITPAFGMALAEAGAVCLEAEGHRQGDMLEVTGHCAAKYSLFWPPVTPQAQRCWNDEPVTTEHGAVGIAVLLAKKEIGYTVIERSRKGTGFDYWMGAETERPFQSKARLEISGIRCGDQHEIRKRRVQKLRQTNRSDGTLPAYVVVVEFSVPVAEVTQK